MEGFEPPPGAVAPMFPDEEEALAATWDVYGEVVDVEAIRKLAGAGAAVEEEDEEEAAVEEEERPTRVVAEAVDLAVAARCAFVDFEGRSDRRSLRTLVAQLAPRQLVVVGAAPGAAEGVAGEWREDLARFDSRVAVPGDCKPVPLRLSSSLRVMLHPQLLSAAHAHRVGQYSLAWLDARLAPPEGGDDPAAGADDPPGAPHAGNPGPDGDPGGDEDREFTAYPDGSVSEVMHISKTMVGKLIGKGGATIMGLQSSSGCSIQVDQVTAARGGDFRRVTLKGTPAAVEAAKEAIAAALAADAPAATAAGAGEVTAEVWCPPTVVGRIIGRAGETIKLLQAASGAYILVNQNFPEGADRQVTASGHPDAVERATSMLRDLVSSDQVSVQGVIQKYGLGKTIKMQCPRNAVGRIIGRGGETVKMLQRKYNASVQIDQGSDPMDVTIIASPSEAEACQAEIYAIISNPEGMGPYGGGPRGGGGGYGMGGMGPRPGMHMGGMMPYGYGMGMPMGPMGMGMGMGYGMPPYGGYGATPYGGYGGYGAPGYDAGGYGAPAAAGGGAAAAGGGGAGVWQAIPDDQGRTYYYNTQTGVSQWEKPADMP